MDLKWTDGKPYERSKRPSKEEYEVIQDEMKSNEIEKSAYSTSLHHDENTWDMLNQGIYNTDGFKLSSKEKRWMIKCQAENLSNKLGLIPS
jgi:hypothetical protein